MKHFLNKTDRKENQNEILNFISNSGLAKIKGGTDIPVPTCCKTGACSRCYAESTYYNVPRPPKP